MSPESPLLSRSPTRGKPASAQRAREPAAKVAVLLAHHKATTTTLQPFVWPNDMWAQGSSNRTSVGSPRIPRPGRHLCRLLLAAVRNLNPRGTRSTNRFVCSSPHRRGRKGQRLPPPPPPLLHWSFHFVASRLASASSSPPPYPSADRGVPPHNQSGSFGRAERVSCCAAPMGASGKWIKSLVAMKAHEKAAGHKGGRKWRLWRTSSAASRASAGEGSALASEASSASADSFSSVLAAVVRAPPRDFLLIRQEWAAVRIQTAFRAFLVSPDLLLCFRLVMCHCYFHAVILTLYASLCSSAAARVSRRDGR